MRAYSAGIVVLLVVMTAAYAFYTAYGSHHNQYDLRIYYHAVEFWLNGTSIYDYSQPDPVNISLGFTYPPIAAVAMAPMSLLPLNVVIVMTFLAIIAATTVLTFLCVRERLRAARFQFLLVTGLVTAVSFCFLPIGQNVAFGQINIFIALLVVADVLVLGRRGSRWFGIGIGVAMAIKLTPGIFLVYLILAKKWRALVVSLIAAAAAIVVGGIFSASDTLEYYTRLVWESDRVGFLDNTTNQSINGVIARVMSPADPSRAAWLVGSAVVAFLAIRRVRKALQQHDVLAAITLTGFLGILVSPVSWLHHVVWILPAGIVTASWFVSTHRGRSIADAVRTAGYTRVALLAVSGMFVWIVNTRVFFNLPDTNYSELGPVKILEGSIQSIWTLAALLVLPIATRTTSEPRIASPERTSDELPSDR